MTMQVEIRMTATELSALSTHEEVIERGLKTFQEVGAALLAIRDGRLYREQYGTFEEYCQQRWQLKQSRAYQLMDAAKALENLASSTIVELPSNESQARPLTRLEPGMQRQVWQEAVETAPNGKVTGAHVAKVAERYMPEPESQAPERADLSLTVEYVAGLIRQALAERDDCPELETYKGSRWSIFLAERYNQWPTIDITRQAIKEVQRKPSQGEPQFVIGDQKPYSNGDILPEGHATEYNPVRLAVTPVTLRPLTTTEGEAVIARYLDRHGRPEDLSYQRAMVESLIITDVQPLLRGDRTITYDTFRNARRRIADDLDRQIHAAKQAKPKTNGMAVHFSSETPEHYTPREVIDAVIACMGGIDLDPCSNSRESPNVPATTHYTQADDGLRQEWQGRVYMNPPYGREIVDWVSKLVATYEGGEVTEAVALVPSRTDTKWWSILRDYPVCLVSGRLKFGEAENGAPFPSAVFYLGPAFETGKFLRSFGHLGDIWQRVLPENVAE